MAWAPDPATEAAAAKAQAEAEAAITARLDAEASKRLNPFERKLLGVLEDLRDAMNAPGPVLAVCDPSTEQSVLAAIQRALPPGSLVTGPNGPILDVHPMAAPRPAGRVEGLLDADPDELGRAIEAGGRALFDAFPALREDYTRAGFEKFAEVAIEAALHAAAQTGRIQTPGGQAAAADGAAGGDRPPAGHPTT